jgi:hypothetical protein
MSQDGAFDVVSPQPDAREASMMYATPGDTGIDHGPVPETVIFPQTGKDAFKPAFDGHGEQTDKSKDTNPKDALGTLKARWFSYIPLQVLIGVGLAFYEGARKYAKFNWRVVGVRASVYVDACVNGHLMRWWEGEDIDAESNVHHIDKAIACLMILRDSILQGNVVDDRPPRAVAIDQLLKEGDEHVKGLIKKYPNAKQPFTQTGQS